ncbi:hypothetical protein L226DRAFT_564229 [Lentinus tigrinus ALCF2SS1-7]|uniref:uncharacterized protein n=1 Tax=Lentinus tigrinus ALCF2SS1-7 TaxID=1328758 RepID=UPI001165E840|nr:hypothetical protein L226DRAFT_564229 [Lentinus tigrinus ALCF2SS1-7]
MSLSTDPRPSPFSVAEFSELVSSAFNIHDAALSSGLTQPLLSLTPPSPVSADHTFDDEDTLSSPFDTVSPASSPPSRKSRSRTPTALRMFHQVRTRASALVLRSRAPSPSYPPSPSPAPFEPLPPPCISPTPSSSSLAQALSPWNMADLSRERRRSRADSLPRSLFHFPKRDDTPPPLPEQDLGFDRRSPTPVLRSFFDDSPARSKRAYSRPPTSASSSTIHPLSRITTSSSTQSHETMDSLPSFFEDTGYQVANPPAPLYSRPATPSGAPPRAHTRLPPLRKSKSSGHGLVHRRSYSRSTICEPPVGFGFQDLAIWNNHRDNGMPSPLTHPRDAPSVPKTGVIAALSEFDDCEPPLPPPYVFERRGSATSTSTGSTRSTSSLSARLSNLVALAFPSKMRSRGRSKLNLSIATSSQSSSADSSPSTGSSHSTPSTPSSPTSAFSHSQSHVYAASADGHTQQSCSDESEEDAAAIGRVLTPEDDPFAKAEIAVSLHGTPRPPTPPLSRAASLQLSPPSLSTTAAWKVERQGKKTRSSLPATPVSAAYTFPSSCSIYPDESSQESESNTFLLVRSATSTPKRQGPPSAWSPFTPPATPSDTALPSTPPSSQSRSPRSPSSLTRSTSRRSARPKCLVFPLPPSGLPPPLPPPDRPLPSLPSTPRTPPVPPKDRAVRVARAHKSLPPSPHPSSITTGSPLSTRSHGSVQHWKNLSGRTTDGWTEGKLKALTERHEPAVVLEVPPSLAEPWSGTVSSDWPSRPETPVISMRPVARRRSFDSTSTVTASPTPSAVHDAAQEWGIECDSISIDGDALLEGDSCSMTGSSYTLSSIGPDSAEDATDVFWSPVTTTGSSAFYSARGSLVSSRTSLETGDVHRAQSSDAHSIHAPVWLSGKSASAGPCV